MAQADEGGIVEQPASNADRVREANDAYLNAITEHGYDSAEAWVARAHLGELVRQNGGTPGIAKAKRKGH